MRSTLTLRTKLMTGAVSMFALMSLLGYFGLSMIGAFKRQFDTAVEREGRKTDLVHTILLSQTEMVSAAKGVILAAYAKDAAEAENDKQKFSEQAQAIRSAIDDLRPMIEREDSGAAIADIAAGLSAWRAHYEEIVSQCSAGNPAEANRIFKELTGPISRRIAADGQQLAISQARIGETTKKVLAGQQDRSRWFTIFLLSLGLLAGGAAIAAFQNISRRLQHAIAGLNEGTAQVAAAASQVSASGQSLAQNTSEQAASLEETSASAEEINSMTHKNAHNSQAAAQFMAEASQFVAEANREVEAMVVSMREINASSDKISRIIKVIDEIAFQTNILALNAAVEAARAGEAGMGFAVVADEVRNLSQRCAQAAKDTAVLIEESIVKSNEGKAKLDRVAGVICSVTESSAKVKALVDEVSLGSEEQARGIDQISKAIEQMEQETQKAAANAQESASAGAELRAQAETIEGIVEQLAAMVGGVATASSERYVRGAGPRRARSAETPAPVTLPASKQMAVQKRGLKGAGGLGAARVAPANPKHALPLEGEFSDF
ncbi:MAG: methyl-accepting chemotaxis protein [Bryobacteraceae bacterium]|jgi:methyl-accepting chemotaxis protein/methyl-accepting chemotaxis protein-1 (serine sensor receptor)